MTGSATAGGAEVIVHGACVAWGPAGLLILGPSGSGKSALALQLMALGCALVADDRVVLRQREGVLIAGPPAALAGMIEARGVGLLAADWQAEAVIRLAVDLATPETERLPHERHFTQLGCAVPLVHGQESAHFPAALLQYLKGGRRA